MFNSNGVGTVYLMVMLSAQSGGSVDGRALLSPNNAAIIGSGVDASIQSLYVESTDATQDVTIATVPPGVIGVTMTLTAPDATPTGGASNINELFSLLTYQVGASSADTFYNADPALPIGPQKSDGSGMTLPQKFKQKRRDAARGIQPKLETGDVYWKYDQTIPVFKMATSSAAPAVSGLPSPANDPYSGISGVNAPDASVYFGMGDVLGNRSSSATQKALTIQAGYTDAILGIAQWPGMTSYFDVSGNATSGRNLTLYFGLQTSIFMPGLTQSIGNALVTAAKAADTYQTAYYQTAQSDISVYTLASFYQNASGSPQPMANSTGRGGAMEIRDGEPALRWRR